MECEETEKVATVFPGKRKCGKKKKIRDYSCIFIKKESKRILQKILLFSRNCSFHREKHWFVRKTN